MALASCHGNLEGKIRCSCKKCVNQAWLKLNRVEAHIIDNGLNPNYNVWISHGKRSDVPQRMISTRGASTSANVIADDLEDALLDLANEMNFELEDTDDRTEEVDEEAMSYEEHFGELQSELGPRCTKMFSLNFLVKLMHLKVMHKWTNRSFDMLCKL